MDFLPELSSPPVGLPEIDQPYRLTITVPAILLIYINASTARMVGIRAKLNGRSSMANAPVEVKRAAPAPAGAPDAWRTFRTEMDRLFERFTGGWGMPSLRRVFEAEPAMRYESSFTVPSPAVGCHRG